MIHDDNVALGRQEYEDMLVNDYYSTPNKLDKRTSDLYKAIYSSIKYPLKFYKHHMPFIDILTLGTNGNCLLSHKTHRYDANYIVINLLKKGYTMRCNKCKMGTKLVYFDNSINKLIDNLLETEIVLPAISQSVGKTN